VFFGKKFLYILALFLALFLSFPRFASANYAQREKEDAVLNNADECFKAMQNEDFTKVWSLLSSKSKSQIIDSVYKGLLKANITTYTKKDIEQDFSAQLYKDAQALIYGNVFVHGSQALKTVYTSVGLVY
jgi:hypothetical protein